ncbi:MAG: hypothetical protein PVI90_14360 [Desulfobacteraceae bacterium]|jgi:MFS family permease
MSIDTQERLVLSKDHYFFQNVFGISAVELLWGLGLPVVIESTFLQLFLKKMGASSLAIGMIPALFFMGNSIFALLSSYLTEKLTFKRNVVIWLHLISAGSLFLLGGAFLIPAGRSFLLSLFFICYAIFCICIGMTLPVWLSYLVNIFSMDRSVAGLGYMNIFQNIGKMISSILILKIVEAYAFSIQATAVVFMGVGGLFGIGALFFLFTKEVSTSKSAALFSPQSFLQYCFDSLSHLIRNRNFLFYMVADLDFTIVVTVISFYANYATIFCGIDLAVAAGFFVTCLYLGSITANFFLGSLDYLGLKGKSLIGKLISMAALGLLISFSDQWSFLLSSFLMGAARGIRMIVMPPVVKRLSGLADATSYFALGPILMLPVAVGLPIFAGYFLDRYSFIGADAYRIIFGVSLVLIFITLIFLFKTDFYLCDSKAVIQ